MNWETCSHRDECINGCRYGKGCYEDDLNNAMGGKPWGECMCGIDENGNVPNSIIKDFIKECTTLESYEEGLGGGGYYDEVFDKEKFAELIIQECTKICDAVQLKYGKYTFSARVCKEEIKNHFGVEE
jgi:hypothetical protein